MKRKTTLDYLYEFKKKYPLTIAWRLRRHAKVIEDHINPGEHVLYAFVGQKSFYGDVWHTFAVAITDQRIVVAEKRLIFGYFYTSITPDLFNDLSIDSGIFWGKVNIDTIKENVLLGFIDKKALVEIETQVSTYMAELKKKFLSKKKSKLSEDEVEKIDI